MRQDVEYVLTLLAKSKFRSRFCLSLKDKQYFQSKGEEVILKHAHDFILQRLAKKEILNDGKQTPMHGHPVFIAQHATATCCRKCLNKWHHIALNTKLNDEEINYILRIIKIWLEQQMNILT